MYNTLELNEFRYAQLQSSILNKMPPSQLPLSNNKFNLKAKFGTIEHGLNSIQQDIEQLSTSTSQSQQTLSLMKVQLLDRELNQHQLSLMEDIKRLEKAVKYGIVESEKRSEKLWANCKERINGTEGLKESMKFLAARINKLENMLGYFSVAQSIL